MFLLIILSYNLIQYIDKQHLETKLNEYRELNTNATSLMTEANKKLKNIDEIVAAATSQAERRAEALKSCNEHERNVLTQHHRHSMEREMNDHDVVLAGLKDKKLEDAIKTREAKRALQKQLAEHTGNNKIIITELKAGHQEDLKEKSDEVTRLRLEARISRKRSERHAHLAASRLEKLKASSATLDILWRDLAEEEVYNLELKEDLEEAKMWAPRLIAKVMCGGKGSRKSWPEWIVQIIIELLSHRTPPSCISPNILTIAESLHPGMLVAENRTELPSLQFIRECCTVLVVVTKTLAAYQLAKAESFKQLFSDGTSRWQTAIQNVVVSILTEAGYNAITLSSGIIAKDETSESITISIVHTFKEGRDLLEGWRAFTRTKFPDRPELFNLLPNPNALTLAKLAKDGVVSTDNCNAARKFRQLIVEKIKEEAKTRGLDESEICVFVGDCWQHLWNVWIGAKVQALENYLNKMLEDDLNNIPAMYRVTTDPINLFRAMEKGFGEGANYPKGLAKIFFAYMNTYNPLVHLWPLSRALGGTRQDIATKASMSVLMNLPYYLEFMNWKISCGTSDSILLKHLFIELQSVEMIAMLCVLAILHVSITIPHCWLSGKCGSLSKYDFGLYDMGKTVDLMEAVFQKISDDGNLILEEEFMMNIFSPIVDKVPPMKGYLSYMFEEKEANALGSLAEKDRWLPYDELILQLFYPTKDYIIQSNKTACELAPLIAVTFLSEFRDTSKATSLSLSSIGGVRSATEVSEEDRKAAFGAEASTSISESVHASSTVGLKIAGTIRLDSVTAEGQTRMNNDFGRGHEALVTGKSAKSGELKQSLGTFHVLPVELQTSLIGFAKKMASVA